MSNKVGFISIVVALFILILIINAPEGSTLHSASPQTIFTLTGFALIIAVAGLISSSQKFYNPLHGANKWATGVVLFLALIITYNTMQKINEQKQKQNQSKTAGIEKITIEKNQKIKNQNSQNKNATPKYWEVKIKAGKNGQFFTDAEVNGEKIYTLIDTGASLISLKWEDAQKARIKPQYLNFDIPVSTANGIAYAAYTKIERVGIDNITVYDVEALVAPKGAQDITLIGVNFLQKLYGFQVEDDILTLTEKP